MSACSPGDREAERLLGLLHSYDRDECWLRTRRFYHLPDQPNQARFDVVDAEGIEVLDRFGRVRSHTLQVPSPGVEVAPGQLVHLVRERTGVGVHILPIAVHLVGD